MIEQSQNERGYKLIGLLFIAFIFAAFIAMFAVLFVLIGILRPGEEVMVFGMLSIFVIVPGFSALILFVMKKDK